MTGTGPAATESEVTFPRLGSLVCSGQMSAGRIEAWWQPIRVSAGVAGWLFQCGFSGQG